ncbi:phospho-N-acetylmuramoyl-pentapeptide-transferase [Nodosilinea sp. E11]|uniref:phospho-N-acetylmuramoyl-pentapeptide- transferase n=1 Tax=Nodosilinea sp. E11 TaxID=3037479 RepID=UPI0029346178|nr:phospho-N-acetylmuramoyl-pentapeptide-transferase [Nodosilinea sp. E11]WOD40824.1 phospho-N-acetylmuramoyl-pentapeptide-transferase [Nodosilinea sp. E11]
MDAKFSTPNRLSLNGQGLFWLLSLGLSAAALGLDGVLDHSLGLGTSMTVPFLVAALGSSLAGFWGVPLLRALKTGQFIRAEGPQGHLKKAGTPTMGGAFFVPVAVITALVATGFARDALAVSALTLAYGAIGWIDDWQVIQRRSNKGISPRTKLGLQVAVAMLFCLWVLTSQPESITTVALPLGLGLPLGFLFWPLAGFVLVAESNATNLTDGLDGLMGGTGAIAFMGLAAIVAPSHPDLMVFCAAMAGACLGFLLHNHNPARVFMGDTGSLALGAALGAVGILSGNLFALLVLTLLFFAETLSVIIQVGYFKATKGPDGVGKRFFKMAPLHHHFELSGWSEIQVVGVAYALTAALATLALKMG